MEEKSNEISAGGTDTSEAYTDAALASQCEGAIKRFVIPAGTTIFHRGDKRHCGFLIEYGEVQIYDEDDQGNSKILVSLGEGEIFGETALVDEGTRNVTAICQTEVEMYVIPREALYERLSGLDPVLSMIIGLLVERYRHTRVHLPESIKKDQSGDFLTKLSRYEGVEEDVARMRNIKEQREIALREMKLEQELRVGLEEKQFVAFLQPILRLSDMRVLGFEALIRWEHPKRGFLTPNHFVPVAERTRFVQHLDALMMERACEASPLLNDLVEEGGDNIFVSVNLSGIDFESREVVDTLRRTLISTGTDPELIKLEITESSLIGDPAHAEKVLKSLKALGFRLSLDDFGTGYSSLGYLHKFSIDVIKIDKSFVSQMAEGEKSQMLVSAIVGLAHNFKLKVVAEGIETVEEQEFLQGLKCEMGQGYLFGKPMPLEQALEFTKENLAKFK